MHFVSQQELDRDHAGMPHGGFVIRSGKTGWEKEHGSVMEFRLTLDSNPEFTASVLVACARAAHRMAQQGQTGCKTMLDIPPALLSPARRRHAAQNAAVNNPLQQGKGRRETMVDTNAPAS